MTAPLRFLLSLILTLAVSPAVVGAPPRLKAVGPAGMHRPAQRSIALRPEDEPPALFDEEPGVMRVRLEQDPPEPATFRSPRLNRKSSLRLASKAVEVEIQKPEHEPTGLSEANESHASGDPLDAVGDDAQRVATPHLPKPALEPVADPELLVQADEPIRKSAVDPRRVLAAPTRKSESAVAPSETALADFSWMPKPSLSMSTTLAATALVSGLLLLTCAVFKKALPKSARPLPEDVVSVLGRMPIAGKQVAQLMRIGGKLVLVSVSPDGAKPITEITDPEEVARLIGLIEQASPQGASAAFQQVFAEVAKQPASPGFLGSEAGSLFSSPPPAPPASSSIVDRGQLAAAYANTPGGRTHA